MIPWLARNTVFILGTNELPFVSRAVFPIRDQLLLDRFHCKLLRDVTPLPQHKQNVTSLLELLLIA